MGAEKIIDEHPGCTDGLRVVILSVIEKWLRVTMVCARINEHFARSFYLFHAGEKIDGCLCCTGIFAASDHQDGPLEPLQPSCINFVKAESVNDYGCAHRFGVVQICI